MSRTAATNDLTVSLESHLVEALKPLPGLLPPTLSDELSTYLDGGSSTIPYSVLLSISKWSRGDAGKDGLQSRTPSLDPWAYDMISLLAGTRTSPDRKFPPYVPKRDEEERDRKRRANERKAITAIFNAVLSVLGSAGAAWYAAGKSGWREEWSVLLALIVGTVVAVSEIILYIIWESRQTSKTKPRSKREIIGRKVDNEVLSPSETTPENNRPVVLQQTGKATRDNARLRSGKEIHTKDDHGDD